MLTCLIAFNSQSFSLLMHRSVSQFLSLFLSLSLYPVTSSSPYFVFYLHKKNNFIIFSTSHSLKYFTVNCLSFSLSVCLLYHHTFYFYFLIVASAYPVHLSLSYPPPNTLPICVWLSHYIQSVILSKLPSWPSSVCPPVYHPFLVCLQLRFTVHCFVWGFNDALLPPCLCVCVCVCW